jgi:hypothetical protein
VWLSGGGCGMMDKDEKRIREMAFELDKKRLELKDNNLTLRQMGVWVLCIISVSAIIGMFFGKDGLLQFGMVIIFIAMGCWIYAMQPMSVGGD